MAKLESLNGIRLVSRLIRSIGSGFPMGSKHMHPGLLSMAMVIRFLRFYKQRTGDSKGTRCKDEKGRIM